MTHSKFIRAALVLGSFTALALLSRPTLQLRLQPDAALLFRARDVRIPVLQRRGRWGPMGAISSMEELPALLERGPACQPLRNVFAATVTTVHLAMDRKVIPCRPLFFREKAEGLSVYRCKVQLRSQPFPAGK